VDPDAHERRLVTYEANPERASHDGEGGEEAGGAGDGRSTGVSREEARVRGFYQQRIAARLEPLQALDAVERKLCTPSTACGSATQTSTEASSTSMLLDGEERI
jgi:hypothetical protein